MAFLKSDAVYLKTASEIVVGDVVRLNPRSPFFFVGYVLHDKSPTVLIMYGRCKQLELLKDVEVECLRLLE